MSLIETFFSPDSTSLKICGVTQTSDAEQLIELGVDALGVNFWPHSTRYCAPETAANFLRLAKGQILRVGVFVNADPELPAKLLEQDMLDIVQFHGDETPDYCAPFALENSPFIRAIGVKNKESLNGIEDFGATSLLLDAHAPVVYGGTGKVFDWNHAKAFMGQHPEIPVMLAGGITPANAREAVEAVRPCAIDIASGAESAPGIKDFDKVKALLAACQA